jgi:hypothetical protein
VPSLPGVTLTNEAVDVAALARDRVTLLLFGFRDYARVRCARTDRQTDRHMYYVGTARVCGLMLTHARGTADAGDVRHALPRRL